MKKILYSIVGCVALGVGVLGTVLPIIPTVPFFVAGDVLFRKKLREVTQLVYSHTAI